MRKFLEQHVVKAGQLIVELEQKTGRTTKGSGGNIQTKADLATEKYLVTAIRDAYPDHAILSEESHTNYSIDASHLWIMDPIDGTNNYAFGRSFSAISLAYAERGTIIAGAVYNPFIGELYSAEAGEGAFRNGERFSLPERADGHHWIVGSDISYEAAKTRHHLEILQKIDPTPFIVMFAAAAPELCWAASGRIDVYLHSDLRPWDVAAASLVLAEAGGVFFDWAGKPSRWDNPAVVAGSERYVSQVLQYL
ncbi:MAG: inositol monophosphatase [Patescibacteria group bacterium]|nr:inositol monophosphatase [Patescibacteria group bacterium]